MSKKRLGKVTKGSRQERKQRQKDRLAKLSQPSAADTLANADTPAQSATPAKAGTQKTPANNISPDSPIPTENDPLNPLPGESTEDYMARCGIRIHRGPLTPEQIEAIRNGELIHIPGKNTSEKQRKANQKNAQKSTGPKTEAGKAVVKQNALKHGLTGSFCLLPTEDEADYLAFRKKRLDSWHPANDDEIAWVEELTQAQWRLRRIEAVEIDVWLQAYSIEERMTHLNRIELYRMRLLRNADRIIKLLAQTKQLIQQGVISPAPAKAPVTVTFVDFCPYPEIPLNKRHNAYAPHAYGYQSEPGLG